ncbi:hypothetical protein RUM43_004277 [Polyplax serrata]|uniref:Peroxisomal membrane protein 11B n=1 Tax=Polyplax serrata TaxID=468196 RepID=A0AAN8XLN2_POLSC
MDTFIKLNSQTAGKDKLARLAQYLCRAMWHNIQKRQSNPYAVDKLKSLEYTLSTFRKLLRLGKSLEVLYTTLKTIHYEDFMVKITCTLSKLSNAMFLLTDHLLWLGRSGLANVNMNKWSEISNRYWLYSIIMNLVRDVYEILRVLNEENVMVRLGTRKMQCDIKKQILFIASIFINNHKDILWDFIKNTCDVWIPMTALGYTKFKPGTIGFLGTISSIAGLISIVNPRAKLLPS